jgi:hypothetical protein
MCAHMYQYTISSGASSIVCISYSATSVISIHEQVLGVGRQTGHQDTACCHKREKYSALHVICPCNFGTRVNRAHYWLSQEQVDGCQTMVPIHLGFSVQGSAVSTALIQKATYIYVCMNLLCIISYRYCRMIHSPYPFEMTT